MAAIAGAVTSERKRTEGRPPKNDPKYTPEEWENLGKQLPKLADENKTATKAAELFNTNRTYVNQAAKPSSKGRIGVP